MGGNIPSAARVMSHGTYRKRYTSLISYNRCAFLIGSDRDRIDCAFACQEKGTESAPIHAEQGCKQMYISHR